MALKHYDKLETRAPAAREKALMSALPKLIAHAQKNAPGFARILKGIKASWEQRDYVVKGNWANVGQNANYAVADACAEALNKL